LSFFARARAASSFISFEIAASPLFLRLPDHRRNEPAFERDCDRNIGMLEAQDAIMRPHGVGRRHAAAAPSPKALMMRSLREELEFRLAVVVRGRGGIRLFAQREGAG